VINHLLRYVLKKRSLICLGLLPLFVLVCLLNACTATNLDVRTQPSPTIKLIDPHYHVTDVNGNALGSQNARDFKLVRVQLDPKFPRENSVINQPSSFRAFSGCNPNCGIYLENLKTNEIYQFYAPSFLSSRPFQDLVWLSDHIIIFDQWTQPHHGVHFAINVREGKLILASPFPDKLP